jgi:lipoprotein-anchoring transpeptidase ErfK/SrfK
MMHKNRGGAKIAVLLGIFVLILVVVIPKTKWWFFTKTGQHKVILGDGSYDPKGKMAVYEGLAVSVPPPVEDETLAVNVLGDSNKKKRIDIDLSNQRLYAYEGDDRKFEFPISSGNPWSPTPTGTFYPWIKLRYASMVGGNSAYGTYYNLPNVPFVMYFANDQVEQWQGYGLHGAYWHNNFGHPMSHGCINAPTDQVEKVFNWADLDTPINIYGTTPGG